MRGRDWLIGHSGSLKHKVEASKNPRFEPVGSTDTELIFCHFLGWLADQGARSLGDVEPGKLRGWFDAMNDHGNLTTVLTDGHDLRGLRGQVRRGPHPPVARRPPLRSASPAPTPRSRSTSPAAAPRAARASSSAPTPSRRPRPSRAAWEKLAPGSLVIIRQGAVRAEVRAPAARKAEPSRELAQHRPPLPRRGAPPRHPPPHRLPLHEAPIEKSTHLFRLVPVHDRLQSVLFHEITLSVEGQQRDYEDVFGNQTKRVLIEKPFSELIIESRSRVELLDTDPLSYRPLRARSSIPLVWMPWQRHMLQPFLLPPELPETELMELTDYAMSFVDRNDYDLDRYAARHQLDHLQGVRLPAGVDDARHHALRDVREPARRLPGFHQPVHLPGPAARRACALRVRVYLYRAEEDAARRRRTPQGEASHAWVQVYLPEVGWKGFDPTNGILTQTEHVRVSVGRSYVDATPTSGTIYVGGGGETLEVDVRCETIK